jgi:hypothetical protein
LHLKVALVQHGLPTFQLFLFSEVDVQAVSSVRANIFLSGLFAGTALFVVTHYDLVDVELVEVIVCEYDI